MSKSFKNVPAPSFKMFAQVQKCSTAIFPKSKKREKVKLCLRNKDWGWPPGEAVDDSRCLKRLRKILHWTTNTKPIIIARIVPHVVTTEWVEQTSRLHCMQMVEAARICLGGAHAPHRLRGHADPPLGSVCALCGQRCRHADYNNMDFHIQLSLGDSRIHPVLCLLVSVHFQMQGGSKCCIF